MIAVGRDLRIPPNFGALQAAFILIVFAVLMRFASIAEITLTSWYRDPIRNAQVGGAPGSRHLQGLAIDIVVSTGFAANVFTLGQASRQIYEDIAAQWRRFGPIFQVELESDHLHLELDLS